MTDALLPLTVCVAIGLFWYTALRARERAIAYARRLCAGHGAQMLDESIALHALRPILRGGKPRLLRSYGFDISYTGSDRHAARLTLVGDRLLSYTLPLHGDAPADSIPADDDRRSITAVKGLQASFDIDAGGNVVPITRARKTLH